MALCQGRSLSGSARRAGASLLVLLIAIAIVSSSVAPAGDGVAEDPLASAPMEGEVERVFNAAVKRSAEPDAAATAGQEAISHSEAHECPGCTRERMQQQMGETQFLAEMRRWRVESFGRQMLSQLGLSKPPQMSLATLAALQRSPPILPDEVLNDAGIGVNRPSTSASEERTRQGHMYIFAANDSPPECRSQPSASGVKSTSERRSCLAFDLNQQLLMALDAVRLELFVYFNARNATVASTPLPRVRLASGVDGNRGETVSQSVKVSSANHGIYRGGGSGGGGGVASDGRWLHVELSGKAQSQALKSRGRLVLELICGSGVRSETDEQGSSNEAEVSCDGAVTLSSLDPRRPFIRVTNKGSEKVRRDTYRTITCAEMDRSMAQAERGDSGRGGGPAPRRPGCCLDTLRINFHRDLNYTFVVFPTVYDINLCRGSCVDGGPAYKRLYTHAMIAEYGSQRQRLSERFAPCCSPARMASLSVIIVMADGFFRDAVIPNMSVSECGCA